MIHNKVAAVFICTATALFANAQDSFDDQKQVFENHKNEIFQQWNRHKTISDENWRSYREQVQKKWNDGLMPSVKTYVEYWNEDRSRLKIDYENGRIQFEMLSDKKITNKQILDKIRSELPEKFELIDAQAEAIDGTILKKNSFDKQIEGFSNKIHFEKKVLGNDGIERNLYRVEIPMVSDHVKKRALKFLPTIRFWSKKYSLPEELVIAVIWQESAFNPYARSHIPAYGLMQIVPRFAGEDVKIFLGDVVKINDDFLYNPENNIKYGISYLNILSSKSFSEVRPFEKQVPFIIAGYNWGPSKLLAHLRNGKIKLTGPREIKEQIVKIAPAETKDYLIKVIERWKRIDKERWVKCSETVCS